MERRLVGIPPEQRAHGYRERAEELRTIAQDFMDAETQRMLMTLAADYERMAQFAERRTAPDRKLS
jgi:hypothetical protein